ncbi:hypothetical protein HDE_14390 [Halotydeus destructor]|nr:hypothetical protein HDE_14390 [Halotydeus destructor]
MNYSKTVLFRKESSNRPVSNRRYEVQSGSNAPRHPYWPSSANGSDRSSQPSSNASNLVCIEESLFWSRRYVQQDALLTPSRSAVQTSEQSNGAVITPGRLTLRPNRSFGLGHKPTEKKEAKDTADAVSRKSCQVSVTKLEEANEALSKAVLLLQNELEEKKRVIADLEGKVVSAVLPSVQDVKPDVVELEGKILDLEKRLKESNEEFLKEREHSAFLTKCLYQQRCETRCGWTQVSPGLFKSPKLYK